MIPQTPELPSASGIRRILCLMINGIGDILCATPTLQALKSRYPEAQLSLIVRPHLDGLVRDNPHVDEVIHYGTGGLSSRLEFFRSLRRAKADLWVDLHVPTFNTVSRNDRNFLRNRLIMTVAAASHRVAYGVPQLRSSLTHSVPMLDQRELQSVNIVDTTLRLAGVGSRREFRKHLPVSAADRDWARRRLGNMDGEIIALFVGSRQPADIWPFELAREFVARLLSQRSHSTLLLLGGGHETQFAGELESALGHSKRIVNVVNQASFGQTGALLQHARALVCTDSGPLHMADALEIPMVALFSYKNYPAIWEPVYARSRVIHRKVPCGPCFRSHCPENNLCMRLIQPEQVMDALQDLLQELARDG